MFKRNEKGMLDELNGSEGLQRKVLSDEELTRVSAGSDYADYQCLKCGQTGGVTVVDGFYYCNNCNWLGKQCFRCGTSQYVVKVYGGGGYCTNCQGRL